MIATGKNKRPVNIPIQDGRFQTVSEEEAEDHKALFEFYYEKCLVQH